MALIAATTFATAQQSAGFKLEESTVNSGGTPAEGASVSSTNFKIRLSSVGGGPFARNLASASFRGDAGFVSAYVPPGRVENVRFSGPDTLVWAAEPSVGVYNLYRDLHSNLTGSGYGECERQGLETASATDSDPVPTGDGFFYLVTAVNRLGEEGTKGTRSDGTERGGVVCP